MSIIAVRGLLLVLLVLGLTSLLLATPSGLDGVIAPKECAAPATRAQGLVLLQTSHQKAVLKKQDPVVEPVDSAQLQDAEGPWATSARCGQASLVKGWTTASGDSGSQNTIRFMVQCLMPDIIALCAAALGFRMFRFAFHYARSSKVALPSQKAPRATVSGAQGSKRSSNQPVDVPVKPRRSPIKEETDAFGCTALHIASHEGKKTEVRRLLEGGANADAREAWEETPLHFAAKAGHVEVCSLLIDHGAMLDPVNADDKTPLVAAAESCREAVCELLLDHGAGTAGAREDELPPLLSTLLFRRLVRGAPALHCAPKEDTE